MAQVSRITPDFSVARGLAPGDIGELAARGFRTVISFLPDGEVAKHPVAQETRDACAAAGLTFVHIPSRKFDLFTDDIVARARHALLSSPGPAVAFCSSGQRAAIIWAAAMSTTELPVDAILAKLAEAGFELAFIRDDLEAQAGRAMFARSAYTPDTASAA